MQLGVIGLGRMGGNITRRLTANGHECVVFDRDAKAVGALAGGKVAGASGLDDLVRRLKAPRAVWIMLPAGRATEETVAALAALLDRDDVIIDGGNSFWQDDIRRAKQVAAKGIHYVDAGTSGGVWGLERGYCLMIGGDKTVVDRLDPIFSTLAPGSGDIPRTPHREKRDPRPEKGYLYAGPVGAGHFVKMVHNGIEYGLMQAYAEGFEILQKASSEALPADHRFTLNLPDIAEVWRRGSVISSWLLDLTAAALAEDCRPRYLHRLCRGFRRRTLDDPRRDRRGGAGRCAFGRALCALPLARSGKLRLAACSRPCAKASAAMSSRRPGRPRRSGKTPWRLVAKRAPFARRIPAALSSSAPPAI